jgi:DNA-binding CsgD family transcriptional regulator
LLFGGYFGNVNDKIGQTQDTKFAVKHQLNSFHFEFSAPLFGHQLNIEYSYFLQGFDKEWSDWGKKTEKDYTNLPTGDYVFQVKARNNLNSESPIDTYAFSVLPPWYQTVWAYLFYIILLVLALYFLVKQQEKKQLKKQEKRILEERKKHEEEQRQLAYQHQLQLEKSEKELAQMQNEKLAAEVEFKNAELASTAMNLVQKKEFILKVKDELQHLNKSVKDVGGTTELKKILRSLSDEEKLNEEWEQFSVHFNKVHGDFLNILKEKYPTLKPHELQLSAYLRMNLSSKEIAQLMSISVRGVEISRYRLRKKLGIATEVNLFQFLFDLKRAN